MIAVDANILVYAHREDSPFHVEALAAMRSLADGARPWAIPWPCIHEFLAIVTHPAIYRPPSPAESAMEAARTWVESPMCRCVGEGPGYFDRLRDILLALHVKKLPAAKK